MAPELPVLTWTLASFHELSPLELQNIHRARQAVFVIEQRCLYADADGLDEHSHHLTAWHHPKEPPWAYARLVAPGFCYREAAIGRVMTASQARARGLGRLLVLQALKHLDQLYPEQGVRISAQAHLRAFYGSMGFTQEGAIYLEDGIAHVEMALQGPIQG